MTSRNTHLAVFVPLVTALILTSQSAHASTAVTTQGTEQSKPNAPQRSKTATPLNQKKPAKTPKAQPKKPAKTPAKKKSTARKAAAKTVAPQQRSTRRTPSSTTKRRVASTAKTPAKRSKTAVAPQKPQPKRTKATAAPKKTTAKATQSVQPQPRRSTKPVNPTPERSATPQRTAAQPTGTGSVTAVPTTAPGVSPSVTNPVASSPTGTQTAATTATSAAAVLPVPQNPAVAGIGAGANLAAQSYYTVNSRLVDTRSSAATADTPQVDQPTTQATSTSRPSNAPTAGAASATATTEAPVRHELNLAEALPEGVVAATFNVAVVNAQKGGSVTVTSGGVTTQVLDYTTEGVNSSTFTVPVDRATPLVVQTSGAADLVVDVHGFFTATAQLQWRDYRELVSQAVAPESQVTVGVHPSSPDHPAPSGWALVHIEARNVARSGHLRTADGHVVYSFTAGVGNAQTIWLRTGATGAVDLLSSGAADLVVRNVAWVPASAEFGQAEYQLLDSTSGALNPGAIETSSGWRVSPAMVLHHSNGAGVQNFGTAVLRVTVSGATEAGYLSIGHDPTPRFSSADPVSRPEVSYNAFAAGESATSTFVVSLDDLGEFDLYTNVPADVVVTLLAVERRPQPAPKQVELPQVMFSRQELTSDAQHLVVAPFGKVVVPGPEGFTSAGECAMKVAGRTVPLAGTLTEQKWTFTMGGVNLAGSIVCDWERVQPLPIKEKFTTVVKVMLNSSGAQQVEFVPDPLDSTRIDVATGVSVKPGQRVTLVSDQPGAFSHITRMQLGFADSADSTTFAAEPAYSQLTHNELNTLASEDGRAVAFTIPALKELRQNVRNVGVLPNLLRITTPATATTPAQEVFLRLTA